MATLGACQTVGAAGGGGGATDDAQPASSWRSMATPADRARIHDWHGVFTRAVGQARASGEGARAIANDAALFDPAAQLRQPLPPAGAYRCRVTKVGAKQQGLLPFIAYGWFACRIEPGGAGEPLRLIKLDGSQRHVGMLWPDDATRGVFLGTLVLGDERGPQPYGADPSRDVAAIVHRIAPQRWRLAIIRPAFESQLDLLELVPVPAP